MQKVFGLKVDSRALDWALLIQDTAVADIGPYGKGHRFVLENGAWVQMRGTSELTFLAVLQEQKY